MIEASILDAGLSAATVAAQLGITPRYVQLLLEETGRTFSRYVLEKRLSGPWNSCATPGCTIEKSPPSRLNWVSPTFPNSTAHSAAISAIPLQACEQALLWARPDNDAQHIAPAPQAGCI